MQEIWLTGSNGQLGQALRESVDRLKYEMLYTDQEDLDITDTDQVLRFGDVHRPDVIINCSGVTDTELCEKDPVSAYKVNALGARNLSICAHKLGAKLVQLSTDDVFHGFRGETRCEYDPASPSTVYGKSKLAGENYVKEFTAKHFIVRSTWVYGRHGENFVNQFLEKVRNRESVKIADDHYGSPTSAADLAAFILELIKTNEYGTFHATSRGVCSRYEFACEILRLTRLSADIRPVPKAESDFSSDRPDYVVLDNFVLSMLDFFEFPAWQDSLAAFLTERGEALDV